jgi:hypothetical protein
LGKALGFYHQCGTGQALSYAPERETNEYRRFTEKICSAISGEFPMLHNPDGEFSASSIDLLENAQCRKRLANNGDNRNLIERQLDSPLNCAYCSGIRIP